MKYTIEGFSQEVALALGLDAVDLVLLRWIVDFYNTDKMEKHYWEKKEYFWVNYQSLIADMPILGISNKMALRRRLRKIEKGGIVEFMVFQGAGNRTFYRFKEGILEYLLSNKTRGGLDPNVKRVLTQMSRGSGQKCQPLYIDPSTIDPSTKDKYLQEVSNFFDNLDQPWFESLVKCYPKIDLKAEFNKMKAWLISNPNNPKKNLKRFVVNWLNHPQKEKVDMRDNNKINIFLNEKLGRIATKDMIKAVMLKLPEGLWWKVDDFLRRRYTGSDGKVFAELKRELMAGAGESKARIKGLTEGIGKEIGALAGIVLIMMSLFLRSGYGIAWAKTMPEKGSNQAKMAYQVPESFQGHLLSLSGIKTNRGLSLAGKASWYAKNDPTDPFEHKFNADGSRFDENAFTCAMRSRDFGKHYKVTNLANNKSIIVLHRDYNPFKKYKGRDMSGRIIDLTKKAFEVLTEGHLELGLIQVKVEEICSKK